MQVILFLNIISSEKLRIKITKSVKLYVKIDGKSEVECKNRSPTVSCEQNLRIKSEKINKLYVRIGKMSAVEYKKRSEAARCEQ